MTTSMQPRDHWIPWYFVAFFVVLALVDGTMVTIAIRTQTGVVNKHPYEQGLSYNQVVKASETQNMLGWNGDISYKQESKTSGKLFFILKDKAGKILQADNVLATITRPTQDGIDFQVIFKLSKSGYFESEVNFPLPGLWEVRIYATQGKNSYLKSKRIVLE